MTTVLCIGHAVQDFVFTVDRIPALPDKYRATGFESPGGGPAATAAVAISKLGGNSMLVARIGDDQIGALVVAELEDYGVDCSLVRRCSRCQTSVSAVLVDGAGERLIVNYLDRTMDTDAEWLPERLPDDVAAVLADTRWPEAALYGLNLARQRNVPAILDADLPVPADGELVKAATHVAFSERGLAEFTGLGDASLGLRLVGAQTDAWCCVTQGARGTLYLADDLPARLPAFEVTVYDTLGAGDVWHGAFALALAEGMALDPAMVFASGAAALKVANGRGRAGTPARRDVDAFIAEHDQEGR